MGVGFFSYFTKGAKGLKVGGTKKSKKIKEAVGIKKNVSNLSEQTTDQYKQAKKKVEEGVLDRQDIVPSAKNKRDADRLKKKSEDFVRETLKLPGFKKGGRIGFKKGTGRSGVPAMDIKTTPTKKLSEKQKKIAMLAGDPKKIDKPDFAKLRNKNKKVI